MNGSQLAHCSRSCGSMRRPCREGRTNLRFPWPPVHGQRAGTADTGWLGLQMRPTPCRLDLALLAPQSTSRNPAAHDNTLKQHVIVAPSSPGECRPAHRTQRHLPQLANSTSSINQLTTAQAVSKGGACFRTFKSWRMPSSTPRPGMRRCGFCGPPSSLASVLGLNMP